MPKISEILEKYSIDRETLAKSYKVVVGKALPAKTVNLKAEERALIEPTFSLAHIGKPKKNDGKVFKAEEVLFGDDFLSWLGFGAKEEEKIEEEDVDVFAKEEIIPVVEKPIKPSFGNAVVVESAPPRPARTAHKAGHKKDDKKEVTTAQATHERTKTESESRGKTFYKFSPNTPSFSKGTNKAAVPKARKPEPARASSAVKKEAATSGTLIKKIEIVITDAISVKEFSEKMWVTFPELMKKFMANKIMVNINSTIDFDTAALIGEEFGVKVKREAGSISIEDMMSGNLGAILAIDKEAEHTLKRPPVVTIMGHVDHGKTKLLDYLRKTNVLGWEAWGITQSIGASQIVYNGEKITFIDTPWHELFTSLRARGAKITNIVVIVIAADDGIKQQTVEAIKHAQNAGVPIMVAITKIDKGISNIDNIKSQMAEHGLTPEDWGGNVPVIPVSAVSWQGIDDLLEQIILQAEMLELKYNPERNAVWVVLEVTKDPKQGVLTTLLLMTGTMKVGDIIMVHNTYGKVRKMLDWKNKDIKIAHGGDPVMILGMQDIPEPGRVAEVVDTERQAQDRIAMVLDEEKSQKDAGGWQNLMAQIASSDQMSLNVIVKADSYGSLEAIKYALSSMPVPENMNVKIINSDVGTFGESDLSLAQAAGALVVGFNVPIPASILKKAQQLKVNIKTYDIIYQMTDYIDGILKGMIIVEAKEVFLGRLTILGIFFKKEKEMIIGGKVTEGKVKNGAEFRIWRKWESGEDEVYGQGKITSLKRDQENVNEVAVWYECGMKVRISKKVTEGDMLEFFVME
jgi:translation initiation factor IF-2